MATHNHSRFELRKRLARKLVMAILLLVTIATVGIVGLMTIEGYTLVESVFMTIITISTVGFEEVRPLSDTGRIFVSILIVSNIGIFAYSVSNISAFLMDGGVREMLRDYTMNQKIAKLEQHVIVCGYGRIGQKVVEDLMVQDVPFVIVESNEEMINRHRTDERLLFVQGSAIEDEVMASAGLLRAHALICTLPDDAANVFVVLAARQLCPSITIVSRASRPASAGKLQQAGANHVVLPELIGGKEMANIVIRPHAHSFLSLISNSQSEVQIEEILLEEFKQDMDGLTLRQLDLYGRTGANIIGLQHAGGSLIVNPGQEEVLTPGTKLIVLGNSGQLEAVLGLLA